MGCSGIEHFSYVERAEVDYGLLRCSVFLYSSLLGIGVLLRQLWVHLLCKALDAQARIGEKLSDINLASLLALNDHADFDVTFLGRGEGLLDQGKDAPVLSGGSLGWILDVGFWHGTGRAVWLIGLI